jgi:carboxypeptidase PM20D1
MIKKILRFLLVIVILLLVIITFNTLRFNSKQDHVLGSRLSLPEDTAAISHLAGAIRIQTISYDEDSPVKTDSATFDTLISFLRTTYPATFIALDDTVINRHSLLLHWKTNSTEKPVILYAHMDVVPVDESKWNINPFIGKITADSIYGRGTIDDKGSMIAIMESVEKLVMSGFSPKRDIYIAFGHDEEADGDDGAKMIASYLSKQNVHAEFLLDEGGLVAVGMVPFVPQPVAMVFTSEKGYLTLTLTVNGKGGHSSRPPKDAPIEILSAAIRKLNENPFKTNYTESVNNFLDYTGPEMRMPFKALFANRWLFGPVITGEYEKIPSAAAMIRTTSVATVIYGGNKENVVPSVASAKINLRLLPGDDVKSVAEKVIKNIDDKRVQVHIESNFTEASKVSSTATASFKLIKNTINKVFPDAVVAPSLLIAQTDSRHFTAVTENIYRFLPVRMDDGTLDGMHGINERIGVKDFMESIKFYGDLISNF